MVTGITMHHGWKVTWRKVTKRQVTNSYYFITRWRVKASGEDVFDIISEPLEFPRWWPAVYLEAQDLGNKRVRFHTRGWLPYTLWFESTMTESDRPHRLAVRATGDFDGRGIWSIVQNGEYCDITFVWKLTAKKPLVAALSFALKPMFEANHRWAMARGEESLLLELARSRARTPSQLSALPAPELPPGPKETALGGLAIAAIGLGALFAMRGPKRTPSETRAQMAKR
jgi:hypothetical protein